MLYNPAIMLIIFTFKCKINLLLLKTIFDYGTCIFLLLFRDASTSLVISRLGSLGVYQKVVCISIVVLSIFHLLSSLIFNFM